MFELKKNNFEPFLKDRQMTHNDLFLSFVQLDQEIFPETSFLESEKKMHSNELDKILTANEDIDDIVTNFVDEVQKNSKTLINAEAKLKIQKQQYQDMKMKKILSMQRVMKQEVIDQKNAKNKINSPIKQQPEVVPDDSQDPPEEKKVK